MKQKGIILLIEPIEEKAATFKVLFEANYDIIHVTSSEDALSLISVIGLKLKIILINLDLPNNSGLSTMKSIMLNSPLCEIITYSETENAEYAATSMKEGASHYFFDPINTKELLSTIEQSMKTADMLQKLKTISLKSYFKEITPEKKLELINELIQKRQSEGNSITTNELLSLLPKDSNDLPASSFTNTFSEQYKNLLNNAQKTQKETILCVEDEEILRENLFRILNKEQYNVFTAEDGETALKQASQTQPIDVIILDIFLPDTSGIELLPKLKELQPQAEVIVLTGFKIADIAIQSIQQGATDYLNKPFSKKELLNTISKTLQNKYLRQTLQELNKNIEKENTLSFRAKSEMFKEFLTKRHEKNNPITLQELATFFPEIQNSKLPNSETLPKDFESDDLMEYLNQIIATS
jgi:DNA-binding NtrC family response regulator